MVGGAEDCTPLTYFCVEIYNMKLLYINTKKPEPKYCHWRNKPEEIAKGLATAASEASILGLEASAPGVCYFSY